MSESGPTAAVEGRGNLSQVYKKNVSRHSFRRGQKLGFKAHPHTLRHACGFALAAKGARCASPSGLSGVQEHLAHGALYRAVTDPF